VSGLAAHPVSALAERVLLRLRVAPALSAELCHEVLGLPGAPTVLAERVAVALLGADPRVRQLPDGRWALASVAQGLAAAGGVRLRRGGRRDDGHARGR
jgi:hypothetical protein